MNILVNRMNRIKADELFRMMFWAMLCAVAFLIPKYAGAAGLGD